MLVLVLTFTGLGIRNQVMEHNQATYAAGLVQRLVDADIAQVPGIITEMHDHRALVDPLLKEQNSQVANDSPQKLHTSLALLLVDPEQLGYLYERLLNAGPTQLPVIREALLGYRDDLVERLWKLLGNAQEDPDHRFRAACVLATYDPGCDGWQNASKFVTDHLLSAVQKNPSHYPPLVEMLRPVRQKLLGPLAQVYRNREQSESERSLATSILADYASDQPNVLAHLLMDADEKQFAVIYPNVAADREDAVAILEGTINTPLASKKTEDEKERLAKRQANSAVALLKMGQPEQVWPVLKHTPDPRVRSYLIHRLGPMGADYRAMTRRLEEEPDVTIRRALLLSLGEYGEKELSPEARKALLPKLRDMYRIDADPGLHAAAEWLLRTWQQEAWLKQVNDEWAKDKEQGQKRLESIRHLVTKAKAQTPPQWYVNGQGQTMMVIPGPVEFLMGSPSTQEGRGPDELQHKKRIGRTFALAAKSVTVEQYRKFAAGYGVGDIERWALTADSPVIRTNWFEAVAYCNWLSKQEGLPESEWCYEPLQDPKAMPALAGSSVGLLAGWYGPLAATCGLFPARRDPEYKSGMKLARNYLQRTGYRLPTEAEMEYATRAGAVTSRYFGETEELLPRYAWYGKNSQGRALPLGRLKPNDLGLFDVYGNVWTWCQEEYKNYPQGQGEKPDEDKEDNLTINSEHSRVLRGGSFTYPAVDVRSAYRLGNVPAYRHIVVGFRAARTLTP
jgi:formylglycine-generating enzyme required for sulfatase activity